MAVKKISPDYSSSEMSKIQKKQDEINELRSLDDVLDDKFYIAARNAHNTGKAEIKRAIYQKYGGLACQVIPYDSTVVFRLQPFKEQIQKRIEQMIREIELDIEQLRNKLADEMRLSEYEPICLGYTWLYQNAVYDVTGGHSDEEKKLLILEFADKERRKFERLKNKFSDEKSDEVKYERTRIPEEVRIAVWRRDQGRCAKCGSRENLEYDHIVPVSKGGSNTARNIELLCQDCNRAKGNRIE